MIEQLHYITQNDADKSHVQLCREACESGVKLVQLRLKDCSFDEYLRQAKECREITNAFEAKLIINDNLQVALESGADGVHLGQSDMNTAEARAKAPKNFVIGGTANTLEQIVEHCKNGVDYVGVGPYRYTKTKEKLSPILGLEGYRGIIEELNRQEIDLPVIAIGGIEVKDIEEIRNVGVWGVAVSGLITRSDNKKKLVDEITKD